MYRIDNATAIPALAAPTAPGPQPDAYWTGGNPGTGMAATRVDGEFLNMLQEEICNCVTDEGLLGPVLNKAARNQLLAAIRREVVAAGGGGGAAPPLPPLTYQTAQCLQAAAVAAPSMVMTTATSFTLPAGNWDLWGTAGFVVPATGVTAVRALGAAIGVGDNTQWVAGATGLSTQIVTNEFGVTVVPGFTEFYAGHAVINLAAPTVIYLMGRPDYDGGGIGVYGFMEAQKL